MRTSWKILLVIATVLLATALMAPAQAQPSYIQVNEYLFAAQPFKESFAAGVMDGLNLALLVVSGEGLRCPGINPPAIANQAIARALNVPPALRSTEPASIPVVLAALDLGCFIVRGLRVGDPREPQPE